MSLLSDIGAETRVQINAKATEVTGETDTKILNLRTYLDDQDTLNFNLLNTEITSLDTLKASKIELQNEIDTLTAYIDAADTSLSTTKMDVVEANQKLADMTIYVDAADAVLEANKAERTELTAAVNTLNTKIDLDIATLLADVIQRDSDLDTKNIDVTEFNTAMDAEILARETADDTLQDNLDAETLRAETAEGVLTTNLTTEISRAGLAEVANTDAIDALDTRLEASKADLTYVNDEITRIDTKDFNQDTELTRLENVKMDTTAVQAALTALDIKDVDQADFDARVTAVDNTIATLTQADTDAGTALAAEAATRSANDGTLNFDTRLNTVNGTGDVVLPGSLTIAINNEVNRAGIAESTNTNAINTLRTESELADTNLSTSIDSLTAASQLADNNLTDALTTETVNRENADIVLQNNINTNRTESNLADAGIVTDLNTEVARAQAAEVVLGNDISTEVNRAEAAELVLTTNLNAETQRSILAEGDLDTEINDETLRAIQAESVLTQDLNDEIVRAGNAETTIGTDLDTEILRAETAEGILGNDLTQEVTRATAAEAATNLNLGNEITRAVNAEDNLNDLITAEADTRELNDGDLVFDPVLDIDDGLGNFTSPEDLTSAINQEALRATAIEYDLRSELDTEVTRANNIDAGLRAELDAEVVRAVQADNTLTQDLTQEIQDRSTADTTLQSNMDSLQSALESVNTRQDLDMVDEVARVNDNFLNKTTAAGQLVNADTVEFKNIVITGNITHSSEGVVTIGEELLINDNVITLNSNLTGSDTPTEDAGVEVNRGLEGVLKIVYWSELNKKLMGIRDEANDIYGNVAFETDVYEADVILQDAIDAEIARATAAELVIVQNLNDEITNRINEDTLLRTDIDVNTTDIADIVNVVTNEINRATVAETGIIDDLSDEVIRATNAEDILTQDLSNEISRALTAENLESSTARANEGDLVFNEALNNIDDSAPTDLTTAINNASVDIERNYAESEADNTDLRLDMEGADSILRTDIATNRIDFLAADATLTSDLADEVLRSTTEDATLSTNLGIARTDFEAADLILTGGLAQEVIDRTSQDVVLNDRIDDLAQEASDRDLVLQSNINDETSFRIAADDLLRDSIALNETNLIQEVADRGTEDGILETAIAAEKARIDSILLASDTDADSFAEIVALVNSVDTENDNAFSAYVIANDGRSNAIEDSIVVEISERTVADNLINSTIGTNNIASLDRDAVLQSNIDVEEQARIDADIAIVSTVSSNKTSSELADSTLQSNIDTEISNRIAADNTLQNTIDTNILISNNADTNLQNDIDTNAQLSINRDLTLQGNIDVVSNDLIIETADRGTADTALSSAIAIEKARIDNILLASSTDTDSFAEIVDLINSVDTDNDNTLASYVLSNDARSTVIEGDLVQEITDRGTQDSILQNNINSEINARTNADIALQNAVNTVNDNLDQEVLDRITDVGIVQSNIDNEESARTLADTNLNSRIDSEILRAQGAEDNNELNLITEVGIRSDSDGTLVFNASLNNLDGSSPDNLTDAINNAATDIELLTINSTDAIDTLRTESENADTALGTALTNETNARIAEDIVINDTIDTLYASTNADHIAIQTNLGLLGDEFRDADIVLGTSITTEETARIQGDLDLRTDLDQEVLDRIAADDQLRTEIVQAQAGAVVAEYVYKNMWDIDIDGPSDEWTEQGTFALTPGTYSIKMESLTRDTVPEGSQFACFIDGVVIPGGQAENDFDSNFIWTNVCNLNKATTDKSGERNSGNVLLIVQVPSATTARFKVRPIANYKGRVELRNRVYIYKLADQAA